MRYLFFVTLVSISLFACKKQWTCDCTYNYSYNISKTTTEISEPMSKNKAKEWCDQTPYAEAGYSRSCELK